MCRPLGGAHLRNPLDLLSRWRAPGALHSILRPLLLGLVLGTVLLTACGDGGSGPGAVAGGKIPLPEMGPAEPYPVVTDRVIPITRQEESGPRKLFVDVVRPRTAGPVPAMLAATAYRRDLMGMLRPSPEWLASRGYAVVLLPVLDPGGAAPEQWIEDPAAFFSGESPWTETHGG